jgi:hypothetical protein
MKRDLNLRKSLPWIVVAGYALGLATALVGAKVPVVVLTICAVLPIAVLFAMRRSLGSQIERANGEVAQRHTHDARRAGPGE